MKFTKDQVREIYQALCAMSPDFMRVFAEVSVEESAAVLGELRADGADAMNEPIPIPKVSDIRDHAQDFMTDMLKDFDVQHRKYTTELEFTARPVLDLHIKYGGC